MIKGILRKAIFQIQRYAASPSIKILSAENAGRETYGEPLVYNWEDKSQLKVGAYCSIASGVKFLLGGNHHTDWVTTSTFPSYKNRPLPDREFTSTKGDIVIGNDVWIGMDALILSGVTIGHGAVIGSRAVVSKSVPPYAIVCGNPAAVVRYRFDDDVIRDLLKIEWWNWPDKKVQTMLPYLLNDDVKTFIRKAKE